jgi:hypothetical protein
MRYDSTRTSWLAIAFRRSGHDRQDPSVS